MRRPGLAARLAASARTLIGDPLLGPASAAWEGLLNGLPAQMVDGHTAGYFLWHDGEGLHLRMHDHKSKSVFSGEIRTDGRFLDVHMVRPEVCGLTMDEGGQVLRFRFDSCQYVDGVDFRVEGGEMLRLSAWTNARPTPTGNIYLGGRGGHPAKNPLVLRR